MCGRVPPRADPEVPRQPGAQPRAHGDALVGAAISCVDLAAFQVIEGLSYAFPRAMAKVAPGVPGLLALRDRVAQRPRLLRYLTSPRRLPFSQHGIFRHYPELDG